MKIVSDFKVICLLNDLILISSVDKKIAANAKAKENLKNVKLNLY